MALVYIGIGSNIGERRGQILKAVREMESFSIVKRISTLIETKPHGVDYIEPKFMNAVVEIETNLEPQDILRKLMEIESEMGRKRSDTGAPREIDLDVLAYENEIVETATLSLPHPRMTERRFVMAPLAELNPEWVHPVTKMSITQILAMLPDSD